MSDARLIKTRLREGIWEGLLMGAGPKPAIEVRHREAIVPGVAVTPIEGQAGQYGLRIPIPISAISDGVQTFLIRNAANDQTLGHFTLIAGVEMEDDIRAEINLMRAELDMLKRAFRRHCLETAG